MEVKIQKIRMLLQKKIRNLEPEVGGHGLSMDFNVSTNILQNNKTESIST